MHGKIIVAMVKIIHTVYLCLSQQKWSGFNWYFFGAYIKNTLLTVEHYMAIYKEMQNKLFLFSIDLC